MAKDQMKQQGNWEKKKEKLDKKKSLDRGSARTTDKIMRQQHKAVVEMKNREQRDARGWSIINIFRCLAAMLIIGLYLVAMMQTVEDSSFLVANPLVTTALMLIMLTVACLGGADWQERRELAAEREQQAKEIKDTLERAEQQKEREQARAERRVLQLQQLKERIARRAGEEKAALDKAKDLCRALRRRREEREAEEAREEKAQGRSSEDGERDAHGWTARQLRDLREAAKRYPDGWSHAKHKRWSMIAGEVPGQDARACEATLGRLEGEVRAATQASKAAGKAEKAQTTATSASHSTYASVQDDFDWLGDGDETTSMGEATFEESEEEDEEEEEGTQERMAIEVEPEHKGTEIRLEGIKATQGWLTVQVEVLHLQLACADCKTAVRVYLSGADEDASDSKIWCEGCAGQIAVRLRPTLLHQASNRLCYVDCTRCNVTDMLPSVLTSVCEGCDAYNVHKQEFARNKLIGGTCFSCHNKYGFGAESIKIEQITPCDPGHANHKREKGTKDSDDPMDEIAEELRYLRKKSKSDPRQQMIVLGRCLPQNGACKHFSKSYKWYRFACCGRAFPCPQCHIDSHCPAAALGAHATRMICGKCSMEQSYSPSNPCEKCNFAMIAKGSSHWDAGGGTRNLAVMSTKDAKKFKGGLKQGTSKFKTSSSKAERVGVKAKKIREHQQKFGKD